VQRKYRRETSERTIGSVRSRLIRQWILWLNQHAKIVILTGWAAVLMASVVLIPGILVKKIGSPGTSASQLELPSITYPAGAAGMERPSGAGTTSSADGIGRGKPLMIPVYLEQEKRVLTVSLEQYVRGVLAAEMPIEFELEALKAQAIAARTYVVKRILEQDFSNVPVKEAWVTDTVKHQAYLTDEAILNKWRTDTGLARVNIQKLTAAVEETRGQIITYEGKPILAAFFSTSNGYTENSEEYWIEKLPYLRSRESPWEAKLSPKFQTTATFTMKEFASKLNLPASAVQTSATPNGNTVQSTASRKQSLTLSYKILEKSAGQRIKKIRIGGQTFTGREVREKLGLSSTEFTLQAANGKIAILTTGNGHGVGMSQWGAQGMALEGYQASEILTHYYSGVQIEQIEESIS
jgi:stage II sporulation protein D